MPQVLEAVKVSTAPPAKPNVSVANNDGFTQTLDQQKRQSQAAGERQESAEGEAAQDSAAPTASETRDTVSDAEEPVVVESEAALIELELLEAAQRVDAEAELLVPVLGGDTDTNVVTQHRPQAQASADVITTNKVELGKQIAVSLEAVANASEAEVDIENQKNGTGQIQLLNSDPKDPKIKSFNGQLEKQTGIPVPVGEKNWSKQFADRVLVLTQQGLSSAKLHLNPAELGPLEIRISVQQDQASISITSSHALVRDSIEQSLPRLRELLEASGLTLVDVDVNAQSQQQYRGEQNSSQNQADDANEEGEQNAATQSPQEISSNRVDFYA